MSQLKKGGIGLLALFPLVSLVSAGSGCLSMKTEHEIKPIRITMDINLKVDRQLDAYLDDIYGEAPGAPAAAPSGE